MKRLITFCLIGVTISSNAYAGWGFKDLDLFNRNSGIRKTTRRIDPSAGILSELGNASEGVRRAVARMSVLPQWLQDKIFTHAKIEAQKATDMDMAKNPHQDPGEVFDDYFESCLSGAITGGVAGFFTGGLGGAWIGAVGGCAGMIAREGRRKTERRQARKLVRRAKLGR